MIMAKILIVEDEIKLRQELEVFLNNNGYQTEIVSDFSDTLDQMLHFNGDLILLDINLPNSSGQFLCKEYRKIATRYDKLAEVFAAFVCLAASLIWLR